MLGCMSKQPSGEIRAPGGPKAVGHIALRRGGVRRRRPTRTRLARVDPQTGIVITVHFQGDLLGVGQLGSSYRRGIVRVNRYEIAGAPLAAGFGAEVLDPFGALAPQARVDKRRVLRQRSWTGGGW